MATTKDTITRWFNEACNRKASHLIIVTDTFDYDDYPVFVMPEEDARKRVEIIGWHGRTRTCNLAVT